MAFADRSAKHSLTNKSAYLPSSLLSEKFPDKSFLGQNNLIHTFRIVKRLAVWGDLCPYSCVSYFTTRDSSESFINRYKGIIGNFLLLILFPAHEYT
jgi:hypothetical protein